MSVTYRLKKNLFDQDITHPDKNAGKSGKPYKIIELERSQFFFQKFNLILLLLFVYKIRMILPANIPYMKDLTPKSNNNNPIAINIMGKNVLITAAIKYLRGSSEN